ncbi:MAG TPA: UPF0146 family protein [Methanobacteriaceae archaeon]|jgi:uncharacterized UPF0146 family protein|nr:UPF0146 family protein [Methanobacteriaceae archaeon]
MWSDFSEYIIQHYSHAHRIVEVGVGRFYPVALDLQRRLKVNIIRTDIKPCHQDVVQDDITHPDLKIYKGAELIYSIRPPEELHPYLQKVAGDVGADLIIKPFYTDTINTPKKMKLINYKRAVFFQRCSL